MNVLAILRNSLVAAATLGLLVPVEAFAGNPVKRAEIGDVQLAAGGTLQGTLMTAAGRPDAERTVHLIANNEVVAGANTNADGRFSFRGIRPGVYSVRAGDSHATYRLWSIDAAPPAAQPELLLVTDEQQVVRGGGRFGGGKGNMLLVAGLIAAAGVIGGVIGYNIRDDDDAS